MPMILEPQEDETQREFVTRCVNDRGMTRAYGDRSERATACFISWRRNKGKSLETVELGQEVKAWLKENPSETYWRVLAYRARLALLREGCAKHKT